MTSPHPTFAAIVLAADRRPDDPVAKAAGVPCKSLTPVGGKPMVFRVLDALTASRMVTAYIPGSYTHLRAHETQEDIAEAV